MLQSWQALKLQLGQNRPSRRVVRAAPCAASPSTWGRPPLSSPPGAAAGPRLRDSGSGRARPGETPPTPSPAPFAAALVQGMRARQLQVTAAEQLPVGERGEARGRQPRPEVSAAEVCVGFPAAPWSEWEVYLLP